MQNGKRKPISRMFSAIIILSMIASYFTAIPAMARDSKFTRQGAGPMYWISYEHQWSKDVFMPEHRFKDNIDWMSDKFLPYGYDMVSTDGWIEGATLLNENGYVVSHNDRWMTDPIYMNGRNKPYLKPGKLFNGDFEYATTEGWDITGNAGYGVNKDNARNNFKFYFYKDSAFNSKVSQTVTGLTYGKSYRLSTWATLQDFSGSNQFSNAGVSSAKMQVSHNGAIISSTPIVVSANAKDYKNYTSVIEAVYDDMTVEVVVDAKQGNTSVQLDDITFEAVADPNAPANPIGNVAVNGGFEQDLSAGWSFSPGFNYGTNDDAEGDKSLWTWNWDPVKQVISQTIDNLPVGTYKVSSKAKSKNGTVASGASVAMKVSGYNDINSSVSKAVISENWTNYDTEVYVTSGHLTLEFIVDPTASNVYSAGIDLDDVSVEYKNDGWKGYPSERYPDGHTWKFWADYAKSKGLKYGIYYNPLWISPEVVNHPDKYKVVGTDTPIADLVIKTPQDIGGGKTLQGDRFDGGQGGDRALYWLNVDHPLAEQYLKGYIKFFADQGASYLRVDFLSWYESGVDKGIGRIGTGHTRQQYENALKWMGEATEANNVFLSLVMPDLNNHGEFEQKYGDMTRIDEDAFGGGWDHISGRRQNWTDSWSQWANPFQGFTGFADISGHGAMINDGDFFKLNTFTGRYADNEKQSAMSLFAMAGSPITIADQYDTIGDNYKFYQNPEIIELNKLGFVGKPIFNSNEHYKNNVSRDSERWAGQLADGSWVIGLFNRSDEPKALSLDFKNILGLEKGAYVRDLWKHEDLGYRNLYSEIIEPHASTVLKLVPKSATKVFEAEVASYQGGTIFNNNQMGYKGFGFISGLGSVGSKLTFAVNVPKAGQYPIKIKYANGNATNSTLSLTVGDEAKQVIDPSKTVTFPTIGENKWDQWGTVNETVELAEGLNLLTFEHTNANTGSVNMDSIQFGSGTAQLVNGDFEMGNETGWNVDTYGTTVWHGVDTNDAFHGMKQYLYSPNAGGKASSKQTINGLLNGHYTLSAKVKLMPHLDPSFTDGVAKMIVSQPNQPNVETTITPDLIDEAPSDPGIPKWNASKFAYQEFTADVNVTEGELTVEFYVEYPRADSSMQIDNIELSSNEVVLAAPEVALYNNGFKSFTEWSRTNMLNQSIKAEGENSFARISGNGAYESDLWQFGNAPVDGNYELSLKSRKSGEYDEASVYVTYSGGTKKVTIPAGNDWSEVKIPNVMLGMDEVVKVGVYAKGKAGSVLDLDEIKLTKSTSTNPQNVSYLTGLADAEPFTLMNDGKTVVLNTTGKGKVKLEFVKDDTAKIWMEPEGVFSKKSSFVVDQETAAVKPAVSDQGDYVLVKTNGLSVRAYKSPFKLAYYDAANTKLLSENRAGNGLGYDGDTGVYSFMKTDPSEHFFGLGMDRDSHSFDRKGKKVVMNNEMKSGFGGNTSDISGTFFTSTKGYGIYFDNTYEDVTFDMGNTNSDYYSFSAPNGEMLYYFMAGGADGSLTGIMKDYADLTGKAPIPPQWALGYIQSKFGYKSWDEVNSVVDTFKSKNIPLDSIVLDAYWAKDNHYFDMTWAENFANPQQNMAALANKGVKIVPLVDPYIQVTANNFVEGDHNHYFVHDTSGHTIIYDAWYGKAGLIDFTNPAAVTWFNAQVKTLHDAGVKGYWIDLNEPEKPTDSLRHQFYKGSAAEITNVYALEEAKAFYDGQTSYTNERVWSLARSGFSGIQEYGTTVWSGDVDATWDSLSHNLQLGLSTSMSGMPYFTTDAGGFIGKPSPELYTRWMQAASFMPIFRAHNCDCGEPGNSREPWMFGATAEGIVKQAIDQRYQLLPYIYSEAKQTNDGNVSLMRPLIMDYAADANVYGIQDQWMFGSNLLVAPIHEAGKVERKIYLPQGTWYDWNSQQSFIGGQNHDYSADLSTIPVLVKEGAIIPTREVQSYADQSPANNLNLKVYPKENGDTTSFKLYEDDGKTYNYKNDQSATTELKVTKTNATGDIKLEIGAIHGSFEGMLTNRTWTSEIKVNAGGGKAVYSVKRNGKELTLAASKAAVDSGQDVWFYDVGTDTLKVKTAEVSTSAAQEITVKSAAANQAKIREVSTNVSMHRAGISQAVQVSVKTINVANGEQVKGTLMKNGSAVAGMQQAVGTISDNQANLALTIPATIAAGEYQIKVEAANAVDSTTPYLILSRMEDSFDVTTTFNMQKLEPNRYLEARIQLKNKLDEAKDVMIIVALYDEKGVLRMVNHSSSSSRVQAGQSLQLNAGFNLPSNVNKNKVKVMVWEGVDLSNTTMMPLAQVIELTP